jgi:hypothetical protein
MTKRNKIIYWIATIWLAFGMAYTGAVQVMKTDLEVDLMNKIGFPIYFLTILGTWKLLGALVILVPKFPLVKEWAYAGFVFAMSGALFCHLAISDTDASGYVGPTLLIVLSVVSWYFRPADRRLV